MKIVWIGAEILGVCVRGLCKIGKVKGEDAKSGYRTKGPHEPRWLALQRSRHLSYKRNKNQLCNYITTESAWLAGIPEL